MNKVKNGPKRPYNIPKRAKNVWKKAKNRVLDLQNCFFAEFSLAELGGTPPPPPPPLTERYPAQKTLAEMGGTPP